MIKGNESDVGNIDLELQAKRGDKFLFYVVFELKELNISLQPDVRLRCDLDQNVTFLMDKWFMLKNQNWILNIDMWLIPLDRVTYIGVLGTYVAGYIGPQCLGIWFS